MTQFLTFEGQRLVYNHSTKTAYTTIDEPFYSAGKDLGWDKQEPGIGLNKSIIDFILKTKCHLVVKVGISEHSYWIYYDTLKTFLDNNNCDKVLKNGKTVKVISWKKFVRLQEHLEI